jgi:hypothetical protein
VSCGARRARQASKQASNKLLLAVHAQAYVQETQVVRSWAIEMQKLKLQLVCRVATRARRCTEPSHRHERRRLSGPGSPDVMGSETVRGIVVCTDCTLSSNSDM